MASQVLHDQGLHDHETQQPGLTSLVSGIISDAQDLVKQQLTLFQVEVKNDMRRTLAATIPIVIGGVVCLLAGIMLCVMLAHLIHWLWPDTIPLWGGYAIVGGAFAALGLALVFWGKAQFSKFSPLPDQTVEGLKENIQWQTKR
jgi:uncharacterized membrane protein YqjE